MSTTEITALDSGNVPVLTLGERLALARNRAGITQQDMADAIGMSLRTIQHYENDQTRARRGVCIAYGLRTGWSWQWIETGETPPGDPLAQDIQPLLYKAARAA